LRGSWRVATDEVSTLSLKFPPIGVNPRPTRRLCWFAKILSNSRCFMQFYGTASGYARSHRHKSFLSIPEPRDSLPITQEPPLPYCFQQQPDILSIPIKPSSEAGEDIEPIFCGISASATGSIQRPGSPRRSMPLPPTPFSVRDSSGHPIFPGKQLYSNSIKICNTERILRRDTARRVRQRV